MSSLKEKLKNKQATVGVVGLGYVGLPLAIEMCRAGHHVIGIDIDEEKIASINKGHSCILDIKGEEIKEALASGRFICSSDFSLAVRFDACSICVPTPLRKTKDPDISFVKSAAESLAEYITKETLVVLESTTYPGTTEELILPIFSSVLGEVGSEWFLAFSPERIDPGNAEYTTSNTPKVIGGITPQCGEMARSLYQEVVTDIYLVGSAREAEMVKLLENTFRAVNIALVNEMLLMCDRMDIDIWRVVDAAATKPFGFMPFYPGPGIGGHCIPIDPMYLSWKAKTFDFFNRFIELATDINGNMPRFVLSKLMRVFNRRGLLLKGSKVLVVGVAYKANVTDTRESPGLEIIRLLQEEGALVSFHDPHVSFLNLDDQRMASVSLNQPEISEYVCVILTAAHSDLDLEKIAAQATLVLDTRNALKAHQLDSIVRL
jgi:UDP-N-acetyl-D-glucosamine dehydrogenase